MRKKNNKTDTSVAHRAQEILTRFAVEMPKDAAAGCVQRVVLLRLVAKWRDYQKRTLDCANSNKASGDDNADRQLRAQAFGAGLCADELEELAQQND